MFTWPAVLDFMEMLAGKGFQWFVSVMLKEKLTHR